jgi:hypothetical protein
VTAALVTAFERAAQAVDSGAGERLLNRWVDVSTHLRGAAG